MILQVQDGAFVRYSPPDEGFNCEDDNLIDIEVTPLATDQGAGTSPGRGVTGGGRRRGKARDDPCRPSPPGARLDQLDRRGHRRRRRRRRLGCHGATVPPRRYSTTDSPNEPDQEREPVRCQQQEVHCPSPWRS